MFKILVNGRNIELTDAIKSYVKEKFHKLDHHFDFVHEVHVFLSVEKNPRIKESHTAEATVHVSKAVVRVEVSSENLYGSIDALVAKVDRSLQKHKTKLLGRAKSSKGESLRRVDFEQAVAEEQHTPFEEDEEIAGVFLAYLTDEATADETPEESAVK